MRLSLINFRSSFSFCVLSRLSLFSLSDNTHDFGQTWSATHLFLFGSFRVLLAVHWLPVRVPIPMRILPWIHLLYHVTLYLAALLQLLLFVFTLRKPNDDWAGAALGKIQAPIASVYIFYIFYQYLQYLSGWSSWGENNTIINESNSHLGQWLEPSEAEPSVLTQFNFFFNLNFEVKNLSLFELLFYI